MEQKVDVLIQQVNESRRDAERAQQERDRLQSELQTSTSLCQRLENQVSLLRADIQRVEAAEKSSHEALVLLWIVVLQANLELDCLGEFTLLGAFTHFFDSIGEDGVVDFGGHLLCFLLFNITR